MKQVRKSPVTKSSGDVFKDIGLRLSDVDRVKINLAVGISMEIQKRDLTQAAAAKIIGADQAKVSNIMRGRVDGFTIDRLLVYLIILGGRVRLSLEASKSSRQGGVTVDPAQAAVKKRRVARTRSAPSREMAAA